PRHDHTARRQVFRLRRELRELAAVPAAAEEEDRSGPAVALLPVRREMDLHFQLALLRVLVNEALHLSRPRRLLSGVDFFEDEKIVLLERQLDLLDDLESRRRDLLGDDLLPGADVTHGPLAAHARNALEVDHDHAPAGP